MIRLEHNRFSKGGRMNAKEYNIKQISKELSTLYDQRGLLEEETLSLKTKRQDLKGQVSFINHDLYINESLSKSTNKKILDLESELNTIKKEVI